MFSAETQPLLITAQNQQGPKSSLCAADNLSHTMVRRPVGSLSTQMCRPGCQESDADLQEKEEMPLGAQVIERCGLHTVNPERDW